MNLTKYLVNVEFLTSDYINFTHTIITLVPYLFKFMEEIRYFNGCGTSVVMVTDKTLNGHILLNIVD